MGHDSAEVPSFWRSPAGIALCVALVAIGLYLLLLAGAVGLYYLLTEHLTHVTQAVPYLFLLACPLMHLFGHHHGSHPHDEQREND